jgi:phospholipid-binding lipoprotein MlaA
MARPSKFDPLDLKRDCFRVRIVLYRMHFSLDFMILFRRTHLFIFAWVVMGGATAAWADDAAVQPSVDKRVMAVGGAADKAAAVAGNDSLSDDPLEGFNRAVFSFNRGLDVALIRPATVAYEAVLPGGVRSSISNVLSNLNEPLVFLNSLLQGKVDQAGQSLGRFITNSLIGLGGLFDPASDFGVTKVQADFGQTLGKYGVGSGPYLVLPVLGPSNLRDSAGWVGYFVLDPMRYAWPQQSRATMRYTRAGLGALDVRSRNMKLIDDTFATSQDPYSTFKSFYEQRRASMIDENVGDAAWDQFQEDEAGSVSTPSASQPQKSPR